VSPPYCRLPMGGILKRSLGMASCTSAMPKGFAFEPATLESRKSKILIVGVGNPLLGDEGVGLHAVRSLSQLPMPEEVDILDCGCDLLNLISYIDKPKKIIILDAIRAGGKPGRIYKFDLDELETIQTTTRSAHQLQAVDALQLLKKVCPCLSHCRIIVMGIEPKAMELNGDLSQEIRESIDDLTRLVREECRIENFPFHILHSKLL